MTATLFASPCPGSFRLCVDSLQAFFSLTKGCFPCCAIFKMTVSVPISFNISFSILCIECSNKFMGYCTWMWNEQIIEVEKHIQMECIFVPWLFCCVLQPIYCYISAEEIGSMSTSPTNKRPCGDNESWRCMFSHQVYFIWFCIESVFDVGLAYMYTARMSLSVFHWFDFLLL